MTTRVIDILMSMDIDHNNITMGPRHTYTTSPHGAYHARAERHLKRPPLSSNRTSDRGGARKNEEHRKIHGGEENSEDMLLFH